LNEHYKKELSHFKFSIGPKTGELVDREPRALPWVREELASTNSRLSDLNCYQKVDEDTIRNLRGLNADLRLDISTSFGEFVSGDFCMPEIGCSLEFTPRDVITMDARLISHLVCRFDG
jgi:hypothetical protein